MNLLKQAADRLVYDILAVQPGEAIAITCDHRTDREMIQEIAGSAHKAGALPLIMENTAPEGKGVPGENQLPSKLLSGALCNADVWIELNQRQLLYSAPFDTAMEKNKNLRYIALAEMSPDVLIRTIGQVDTVLLQPLMRRMGEMIGKSKKIRVTTASGTDAMLETDPSHFLAIDCGDASKPGFHTLAGCINIVPRFDSVNGDIVFDGTLTDRGIIAGEQVHLTVKKGKITSIDGTEAARWFADYVKSFRDPVMYCIAHLSIGLNPGAVFSGCTPEDERGWGVTTWGMGNVPAEDAPPHGRKAISHCDGTSSRSTIWFDDRLIMKDGELANDELIELAGNLRRKNHE